MFCLNLSDIATITVKNADYCCMIHGISKSTAIDSLENSVLDDCVYIYKTHINEINFKNRVYNYYFDNLVKAKKSETKNILIYAKNFQDLTIYFTRYVDIKSITIQKHEGK